MINGIYPPLPTPFRNDEIDFEILEKNIDKFNSTGLNGYVSLGSNGESVFLTREEKIQVIKATKQAAAKGKKIIAGTGTDSIKETIFITNEAAKAGADAALILTPSYYQAQMTPKALISYFNIVADNSGIPVFIYNVPKFTGIDIQPWVVAELSGHKNIIGIKDSTENIVHVMEILKSVPDEFILFTGTGSMLFSSIAAGAKGGIVALANVVPGLCVKIGDLISAGKPDEALKLQNDLLDTNKAVTARFGVAGLKKAMDLMGYSGGEVRNPLQAISDADLKELEGIISVLKQKYF